MHLQLSSDPEVLTSIARIAVIEKMVGRSISTAELAEFLQENEQNLELMARIDAEALAFTAVQEEAWGTSVQQQAVSAAQNGRWGYYPGGPKNVLDYLKMALEGTEWGGGKFYRISTLIQYVLPYCAQKGIPIPPEVWKEGGAAKFQFIAEKVPELKAAVLAGEEPPAATETKVRDMLEKAADKKVTLKDMKQDYPPEKRRIKPAEAWEYLDKDGRSYLVIEANDQAMASRIKAILDYRINVKLGTGHEPFIHKLGKS